MHVISRKALTDFAALHANASTSLDTWYRIVKAGTFANFADLKRTFNSVDRVGDFYVFDIAGNKFRVIAAIHFDQQRIYIRHVFTHAKYDDWSPQ